MFLYEIYIAALLNAASLDNISQLCFSNSSNGKPCSPLFFRVQIPEQQTSCSKTNPRIVMFLSASVSKIEIQMHDAWLFFCLE